MEIAVQVGAELSTSGEAGIEAMVAQAVLAERLGFDAVFVPDHYVYEVNGQLRPDLPAYDCFFALATLAQRTRHIRIGSHVACLLFRHPAMTARLFAQVDEASGGRVIAGVGAGWTRAEFAMMGIPFPDVSERLRMLDEAVAIMRGLWRDEHTSFEGQHFRVTAAVCRPKPVQQPGPPLMLGGGGNGILRRAGAWADIVHVIPALGRAGTLSPRTMAALTDQAFGAKLARVRAAAVAAGRPADAVRAATTIFLYVPTRSPAETQALAAQTAETLGIDAPTLLHHPSALLGTENEMVDELRRREATHGLSLLGIHFADAAQLETFGESILPRMK